MMINLVECDPETVDMTQLVMEGKMEILTKKLMKYPHLKHQQNEYGDFIAHTACRYGRSEVVMLLGRLGYDFNLEYNSFGFLPIHTACQYKHLDCVLALRCCGARMDAVTESDLLTPLHIACRVGYLPVVQLLLKEGCKVYVKDAYGHTPHSIAMRHENLIAVFKGQVNVNDNFKQCLRKILKVGDDT